MNKLINTKGSIIDDPISYLINIFGNQSTITKYSENGVPYDSVGELRQRQYETHFGVGDNKGKPVKNCTLSAITNAFAFYRNSGYSKIPEDQIELYKIVKSAVKIFMYSPIGGIIIYYNGLIINSVWNKLGYKNIKSKTSVFNTTASLLKATKKSKPYILSIMNGKYHNHTVCVCGSVTYKVNEEYYSFLKIRDNWSDEFRYISQSEHMICTLTDLGSF